MMTAAELWRRFRFRWSARRRDQELQEEMQQHAERLAESLVAGGTPLEEARRAARVRLGNPAVLREQSHDSGGFPRLESFAQDMRFGLRLLRRSPSFTALAVLTLALGIGANTAAFSAVNALLLRPLPFAQPERLVRVWGYYIPLGSYRAHAERTQTVDLAAFRNDTFNLSGQGEATRLYGGTVSTNFFEVLGVRAALGRTFRANEDMPGNNRVVVLSNSAWQNRFAADPGIIGRNITLDGVDREVVGVMPAGFAYPVRKIELWAPIARQQSTPVLSGSDYGPIWVNPIGRLRPHVTLAQARAELKVVVPQVVRLIPWRMPTGYGNDAVVNPLQQELVGNFRIKLLVLMGAVGLVLLIACANVANLLLARAAQRQREIAVRSALGAGRGRIVRQLITESLMLALLGGLCGALLAPVASRLIRGMLPLDLMLDPEAHLDLRLLGFAVALALVTGIVFGLLPALRAPALDLEQALKGGMRTAGTRQRRRLSASLVVLETALAMVLAVAAGLLVRSLWQLSHERNGFASDSLLTAHITPSPSLCREPGKCKAFYDSVFATVHSYPGVQSVAYSDFIPFGEFLSNTVLAFENHPQYTPNSPYQCFIYEVGPTYFQTLGIPLLKGRTFTEQDRPEREWPGSVAIVSRALAARVWPGQDPIGKRLKPSWTDQWLTVVGVVGDVRFFGVSPGAWADPGAGVVYYPYLPTSLTIAIRTSDAAQLAGALPRLVARINATVPVSSIRTMDGMISESIAAPRSTTWLFTAFSALALALGAIGVYSLISYWVTAQTREIGIRMALGADQGEVLRRTLAQGLRLGMAGVAIGSVAAFGLTRWLRSLLYGVAATDAATFLTVAFILLAVAALASYVPARRATQIDPMIALRYE